jgi:hypothetical protein
VAEEYPARPGYPAADGWAILRPPPGEAGLRDPAGHPFCLFRAASA